MRIDQFDGLALSQIEAADTLDTMSIVSGLTDTIAGTVDAYGSGDARLGPGVLSRTFEVHGTTPALLDVEVDKIRAKVGKRGLLRVVMGDSTTRTITARLLQAQMTRTRRNFNFQTFRCDWEIIDGIWQGAARSTTVTLDVSPKTVSTTNSGNRTVTNAIITVTAGGANITALTIAKTGETSITWTGTLATTKQLVIDCGAFRVTNDGANAYAGLTLGANHKIAEWLRLTPGANSLSVTKTGGSTNSTINIAYNDGWS